MKFPLKNLPIRALAISVLAILASQPANGADFLITPTLVQAGEDLRFQITMQGDPGPEAIWVAGTERVMGIRINPDRRPGKTPGNCVTVRHFTFDTYTGWGLELDITGPDVTWSFPNLLACTATTALRPGDYIVSLDYQVSNGDGTSTYRIIDVPVTVFGDRDGDGVLDPADNCPGNDNPGQEDADHDGQGDACDPDDHDFDNDGIQDAVDNCRSQFNPSQVDSDGDRLGDACDPNPFDRDNDAVNDALDNCPTVFNPSQDDSDGNGVGNACEPDLDGDGVLNPADNCPLTANADQRDSDFRPDGLGDACDPPDSDGDRVIDTGDNCPAVANATQVDSDGDGEGDACDQGDSDGDGVPDAHDNCAAASNPFQQDTDNDGLGNACETDDTDQDGSADGIDNCPAAFNPGQFDVDHDGVGDICDPDHDPDGDGVASSADNCDSTANPDQRDANHNEIGDACDVFSDTDNDGLSDAEEHVTGTDPSAFTVVQPGINTYANGQPTGAANAATVGDTVGVAIAAAANVDAVIATVTDPAGVTVFNDTLIPHSPVVLSFVPNSPGTWRISARLYDHTTLTAQIALNLIVLRDHAPTPARADDCKNDGWKRLYRGDGTAFKNQGACVSYVSSPRTR